MIKTYAPVTDSYINEGQQNIKVPTSSDYNAIRDTVTNPSGNFHNGAETKIKPPLCLELVTADVLSNYWFTHTEPPTQNILGFNDMLTPDRAHAINQQIYASTQSDVETKKILTYNQNLTNDEHDDVIAYVDAN